MYKLNTKEEIDKFVFKERLAFVVLVILCIAVIFAKYYWLIGFFWLGSWPIKPVNDDRFYFILWFLDENLPILLMTIIFATLLYYLKIFHHFEFKKNITNMLFFFLLEVSLIVMFWIDNF